MSELKQQITELSERVLMLPNLIREKQEQNNHADEITGLEKALKDKVIELALIAGTETDDDGKKKYTNQTMREARARELAEDDDLYKENRVRLTQLKNEKANLANEIQLLNNELSASKAVLYAMTERLKNETVVLSLQAKAVNVEVHHVGI